MLLHNRNKEGRSITSYDLAHLDRFHEPPTGSIQSDEALFLYALTKVLRPRTIVEFGFFRGDSAMNFLMALDREARLYSFDPDEGCKKYAETFEDPRFKLLLKPAELFEFTDVDNRSIDVLFIDTDHLIDSDITAFSRVNGFLADQAVVVIHDTGAIDRRLLKPEHQRWSAHLNVIEKEYENGSCKYAIAGCICA